MLIKTTLAACIAAAFSLTALPSMAADTGAGRTVWVRQAPPELRVEQVPEMRRGYQWVPGYWEWQGRRHGHVWKEGTWIRARQGYVYAQPMWVERDGRWHMQAGQWSRKRDRDRDGDGVPDGRDRDRDGDGVPNARDRDRDGDGVRNSQDRRPDNPNRR